MSKATIYGWVSDIPLQRPRQNPGQRRGNETMAAFRAKREASYEAGVRSWPILSADPRFREFVSLYLAEG